MLRLIEKTKVKKPFYHETIAVHIYSMEELCYFIETHIYLIDPIWVGDALFSWIETELGERRLAENLRQARRKKEDEFSCVELILRASGIYSEEDLGDIVELLGQMRGKTKIERRKMSGDLCLEAGKYRQAAYIYMDLLEEQYVTYMTEELRGNIYHNLGVIYARMFLFDTAAGLFARAYTLRKDIASRDAYLYAMNFSNEDTQIDEGLLDLNLNVMREVLAHLAEVSDETDYYVERKKASIAADAVDWKSAQTDLMRSWAKEYRRMI